MISGGGSLAKHLDLYLRLTSGKPLPGTEIKIVDIETRQPVPIGHKGLVLIRGPQVMQGYYRDPEATAKAIDSDGWFDSGDLGMLTANNDLTITGRAKDTWLGGIARIDLCFVWFVCKYVLDSLCNFTR
jgi:long-subunit acyl-CoA synthetase (AMP-forming)